MSHYIYSTLAASMEYTHWEVNPTDKNALPIKRQGVFIKGGAGVANKHLMTPRGVCTIVSDAELEILQRDVTFQLHVKKGFITIDSKEKAADKVAADMNENDKSKPWTPEKIAKTQGAKLMDGKKK